MKKLIVGLGNPGLKYKYSRHNTGFILVDALSKQFETKLKINERFKAAVGVAGDLVFMKPQDFMNASGEPIVKVSKYYDVDPKEMYVIHDDLDLPMLKIKKQFAGSSAGHHGVDDVIEKLKTGDFWRIRIGIGRPENTKIDTGDWVLTNFSKPELESLVKLSQEIKTLF